MPLHCLPSCAVKPVHTHTYTRLRRTFGSGLRNSDCSSILSSAGLSADDHTPVQLDPTKMLLYTPTFDLSIFIWLSPSLIILSSSISTFISLSLYYSTLLFLVSLSLCVCVCVCVCVLLGRVKRLTDRKYSSSENSSLACMCSLKWKQRRSLTNIWMRSANCARTKSMLSIGSIQDHQAIDTFSMSHKDSVFETKPASYFA